MRACPVRSHVDRRCRSTSSLSSWRASPLMSSCHAKFFVSSNAALYSRTAAFPDGRRIVTDSANDDEVPTSHCRLHSLSSSSVFPLPLTLQTLAPAARSSLKSFHLLRILAASPSGGEPSAKTRRRELLQREAMPVLRLDEPSGVAEGSLATANIISSFLYGGIHLLCGAAPVALTFGWWWWWEGAAQRRRCSEPSLPPTRCRSRRATRSGPSTRD